MLTTINKISCNLKDEMKKKNNLISIALKLIEVIFLVILSLEFFDLFLICILFKIFLSYLNFSSSFNGVIDNFLLLQEFSSLGIDKILEFFIC